MGIRFMFFFVYEHGDAEWIDSIDRCILYHQKHYSDQIRNQYVWNNHDETCHLCPAVK